MPEEEFPQVWRPEFDEEEAAAGRNSRAATASLILGLLGLFCLGPLAAVPGLVLALVGIRNTGYRGRLGRGRAMLGLLFSGAALALWIGIFLKPEWRSRVLTQYEKLRGSTEDAFGGGGTELERNERKAVQGLRLLRAVQEKHKAKHGTYARGPGSLVADDPECAPMATSGARRVPHHGYYFSSVIDQGTGFVDHSRSFLIIAVPAEYGRSGRRTFAIGPSGKVLGKDVGKKSPTNAAALAGWPAAD